MSIIKLFDVDKMFGFFKGEVSDDPKVISDQNKFDIMYQILQNSPMSQLNGGTFDTIKAVIKNNGLRTEDSMITSYVSMTTMKNIIKRMNTGKALIGVAANVNAMHSQWIHSELFNEENKNLTLSSPFLFNKGEYDNLSSRYSEKVSNSKQSENNFFEKDGIKISTPFKLNSGQIKALNELIDFVNNADLNDVSTRTHTLEGYAGTGKTTIMKIFNDYIKKSKGYYPIYFTATTHRANQVLSNNLGSNVDVTTLHSALGLRPDESIEEFDLNNVKYDKNQEGVINDGLLVVDEASMINDDLYKLLEKDLVKKPYQILFVGDPEQIKPVKQNTIAKPFTDINKSLLTKVERTGNNPLLKESMDLRNNKKLSYVSKLNDDFEGVQFTDNKTHFINYALELFKSKKFKSNKLLLRVIAATNKAVTNYNNIIRNHIYDNPKQYVVGDLIMGYANWNINYRSKEPTIANGIDYEITNVTPKTTTSFGVEMSGFNIEMKNIVTKRTVLFFTLDRNTHQSKLNEIADKFESLRNAARANSREWKSFYSFKDSFATPVTIVRDGKKKIHKTFDYGYSHTIHKSQGGTYDYSFVDEPTIDSTFTDKELVTQLKYVGVTRASKQAVIYSKNTKSIDLVKETLKEQIAELVKKRLITQNIAEVLAAVVDNGKDPLAEFFNLNLYTADVFMSLLSTGVDLETAMLFIGNPALKDFTQYYFNSGANFQAEDKAKSIYGVLDYKDADAVNLNKSELKSSIKDTGNKVDKKYESLNKNVITMFLKYKDLARDVSDFLRASKMGDTAAGPNDVQNITNIRALNKPMNIAGASEFLNSDMFMNEFAELGVVKAQEVLETSLQLPKLSKVDSSWQEIYRYFTNMKNGLDLTVKEFQNVVNHSFSYLASNFETFTFDDVKTMLDETPTLLREVKNSNSEYNVFLNNLHIDSKTNFIEWRKPLDKNELDYMRELWEDMVVNGNENEQLLANALLQYSFLSSGFRVGPKSFSHMQPISFYSKLSDSQGNLFNEEMRNQINAFDDGYGTFPFIHQYIRNNYKKMSYLPSQRIDRSNNPYFMKHTTKVEKVDGKDKKVKKLAGLTIRDTHDDIHFTKDGEKHEYIKIRMNKKQYLFRLNLLGHYDIVQDLGNDKMDEYSFDNISLESKLNDKVERYDFSKDDVSVSSSNNKVRTRQAPEINISDEYLEFKERIIGLNISISDLHPGDRNYINFNGSFDNDLILRIEKVKNKIMGGINEHYKVNSNIEYILSEAKSLLTKEFKSTKRSTYLWNKYKKGIGKYTNITKEDIDKDAEKLGNGDEDLVIHLIRQAFLSATGKLWLENKDKLLKQNPNLTKIKFNDLILEEGFDYVEEYINKCRK